MRSEDVILHICPQGAWQAAQAGGEYRADSLDTEGFIHCSQPEQVLAVANRYYRGVPDLVVVWIDPTQVIAEIRWEPALGEVYPHIYGALNTDAVAAISDFASGEGGIFYRFPEPLSMLWQIEDGDE